MFYTYQDFGSIAIEFAYAVAISGKWIILPCGGREDFMRWLRFSVCALLLTAVTALGQTSRGTVTGIITDPQSGVIPAAKVELTNLESGVMRSTTANAAGLYRFDAVDPGVYSISVMAPGFKSLVTRSVVQAGQVLSKDARLEVGETKVVIEVQAELQPLQYEAPVRGGNLEAAQITQLPFSSRDAAQLALTLPGVSTDRSGMSNSTFIVNGSRGRSNNFMVDGTENNDQSVAGQAYTINMTDAVAEVSVQTANFDAEYGRAGGAVVNTITKQGTNRLHGSLFYLLDATIDDAITNTQMLSADIVKRGHPLPGTDQWYGVTVGGPIRKNKTFFFGAFQDERQNSQNTNNLTVPTAAGWATFNSLFPSGANPRADLYKKIAGGVVADSQTFPLAMGNSRPDIEFGTAISPYANKFTDRQMLFRVDHLISNKDQLAGRYFRDKNIIPNGGYANFFPGFGTSYSGLTQSFLLSETHVFAPSTTNELRLPYSRVFSGWPLDAPDPTAATLPLYTIGGGVTAIGLPSTYPQGRLANIYAIQDTVSHVRSTHSFRFGLTLTQQRARQFAPIRQRGEIAYGTTTGYSNFANFIDDFGGSSGAVYRDFGNPAYYPNYTRQAYFAQDRWRATQSLTLTLGLRYEYFGTPMNVLKKSSYSGLFNVNTVTATGPFLDPTKVAPDKNNWAPTMGLAYSPSQMGGLLGKLFGDRKTVIRAGYQIGYDSYFNNITSNAATAVPNLLSTTTPRAPTGSLPRGIANWSQQMPVVARTPLPNDSQTLMSANLVNPYYQRWSLGIQRELPANLLLDVSYVGTKGTRLFVNEDMNPVVPALMRINPAVTPTLYSLTTRWDSAQGSRLTRTNGGDSNYNALQIEVNRRMAAGLLFKASYTWSKVIDNASEIFSIGSSNSPQNTVVPAVFGGLTLDRGLSTTDRPHRAVFSYVYLLPFLKNGNGVFGQVLGGWQVSGVATFESGRPLNIYNGLDADGIGGNWDRPTYNPSGTPGVRAQCATAACTSYINPDAAGVAIDPATAMYIGLPTNSTTTAKPTGNLGRNTARMPGLNNWSANVQKTFKVKERLNAEFRAEFYNIWNHAQFGTGSVSPFSPGTSSMSADVARSPAGKFMNKYYLDGGSRVIRYQLRLVF